MAVHTKWVAVPQDYIRSLNDQHRQNTDNIFEAPDIVVYTWLLLTPSSSNNACNECIQLPADLCTTFLSSARLKQFSIQRQEMSHSAFCKVHVTVSSITRCSHRLMSIQYAAMGVLQSQTQNPCVHGQAGKGCHRGRQTCSDNI